MAKTKKAEEVKIEDENKIYGEQQAKFNEGVKPEEQATATPVGSAVDETTSSQADQGQEPQAPEIRLFRQGLSGLLGRGHRQPLWS